MNKDTSISFSPLSSALLLLLLLFFSGIIVLAGNASAHFCADQDDPLLMASTLGDVRDSQGASNSADVDELARFAVEEHNKKENSLLEFVRVVKAKEQVVAGTLHHLTVEVVEAGKKKLYEAKVWVKSWMNFKELQEFKHAGDVPSITPSDLGAKKGDHPQGWREVAPHDPHVQDAAQHALRTIQQRSNSLVPYELLEIIHAKAEVIEDAAKFDLLLKLKRGSKEEKFKVEVHKNNEDSSTTNPSIHSPIPNNNISQLPKLFFAEWLTVGSSSNGGSEFGPSTTNNLIGQPNFEFGMSLGSELLQNNGIIMDSHVKFEDHHISNGFANYASDGDVCVEHLLHFGNGFMNI